MRAALLTSHGLDGLSVVDDLDRPVPAAGEVLVRVQTVGVNQLDLNVIAGLGPGAAARLPRVLGLDPAGVIEAVGSGVSPARVGEAVVVKPNIPCGSCAACAAAREADCAAQTVVGVHREGGAAEYVAVPAASAFARGRLAPELATAAVHSLPIVINALDTIGLVAGERVLVTGAGGTLGQAAVDYARHLGAEVTAASRRPIEAADGVRRLMATDAAALASALEATGAPGFDVVLDVSGHAALLGAGIAALAWGGRAVFCAASIDSRLEIDAREFYLRRKRLHGVASADLEQVRRALELVQHGEVTVHVGSRHPLDEIATAYRDFAVAPPGKVIIDVA
ncbi:alcohol dehydrogenase catalytic domain-containing protein [Agromyces subbeticus]|uniref:alcohol dehydrogenase catalytic domain-containing protein n=1 Tax=Agromyces subbeticus TaxID=293890 RepID=UPI0003B6C9EC|nr:alcohol dehydrogenase catalytic domain-containing protein [Agromyces subbeticus]